MDIICDKTICLGCGLCVSKCPKQCIYMQSEGALGHLFPKINQSNCIDCGLCQKNCPALHRPEFNSPLAAYAAWSKDMDDYQSSTSGGAASVLSQYVIEQGGIVYGCTMLPDIEVKHIRVDKKKDLNKLKGSKYVQSDVIGVYSQLKKDVDESRLVLFIGTPCQVAAVKKLFKIQPENLILVDLICHGVPSVELLKQHVSKIANYPHYDNIIFRDGTYIVEVVVDENIVYRQPYNKPRYKDFYINSFYDGYTYRESCYKCPYAQPQRISDITIGDFWNLGKIMPADSIPEHRYGCSLIMPSTEKGIALVKTISPRLYIFERSVEEAVKGNDQLKAPVKKDIRIRLFRQLFPFIDSLAYRVAILDKFIKYNTKCLIKKRIGKK